MPLWRPVAEGGKFQILSPRLGIHVIDTSSLHKDVVLSIDQIEEIILSGFLAGFGHGLCGQQGCDGGDQE